METVARVLDPTPAASLEDHLDGFGGNGIDVARSTPPDEVLERVEASGLRGRGGAGFPTGRKWRTVAQMGSPAVPTTVVVNAAEGEPGTFKDRAILRRNPYRVLEGALIAALVVGADRVLVAVKRSFRREIERLRATMAEVAAAGWSDGIDLELVTGPDEYLFGEETGLLEVLDGRPPFPRVSPPYRHGVDELGDGTASAAGTEMAAPDQAALAPPTLVNNVETFANIPRIVADGPDWFREVGTDESPGTIVCTVTGATRRESVGEVAMGTPLRDVIRELGDGPEYGHRILAVLPGAAHPLIPEALLDTPTTYEDLDAIGSGLGSAGFIVFDETADPVAIAHGVSRFLAIESCGQCTPCKQDGLAIASHLERLVRGDGTDRDIADLGERVEAVTVGARCYLAHQQQRIVESVLSLFLDDVAARAEADGPVEPVLVAPIVNLERGQATIDESHATKQPDWSHDAEWSGQSPADQVEQRV